MTTGFTPLRIYIAGPMTGVPDHNFPLFRFATDWYRHFGHHVISPHEGVTDTTLPWETYMRRAIVLLSECNTIAMLPHWHKSKGAKLELQIADALGMNILFFSEDHIAQKTHP